ncbi:MAG: IS66 family insertion sequence element accessory protein TnpB [Bacillota bacterium]
MSSDCEVYLACGPTDMRKSINGLCDIVQNTFNLDPFATIYFVFCNRQKNRIKILTWEENGFWLHFK